MAILEDQSSVDVDSVLSTNRLAETLVEESKVPDTEKAKIVTFETLKDPLYCNMQATND